MKVLIFSDIHGDTRALEKLIAQPADIYIAAGDLSTFGKDLDRCGKIMKPLGEKVWVLPGNHESHDDTRAFLSIPARHDVARRIDCGMLAQWVSEHRLEDWEAAELAVELAYSLAKRAYRL